MDSIGFRFPSFGEMPFLGQLMTLCILALMAGCGWLFWEGIFWLVSHVSISIG